MDHLSDVNEAIPDTLDTSNLVLVNLDFNDGFNCEALLEPEIVNRLHDGDMALMEQLRSQYSSGAATIDSPATAAVLAADTEANETEDGDGEGGNSAALDARFNTAVKRKCAAGPTNKEKKVRLVNSSPVAGSVHTQVIQQQNITSDNEPQELSTGTPIIAGDSILLTVVPATDSYPELTGALTGQLLDDNNSLNASNTAKHMDYSMDEKFPLKKKVGRPRRYMKYTAEDKEEAVRLVSDGELTHLEAAKKYGIPAGTLHDTVNRVVAGRYSCTECDKKYALEAQLTKHKLKHTRKYAIICCYCGVFFNSKGGLKRHIFRIHSETALEDFGQEYIDYRKSGHNNAKWSTVTTQNLINWYSDIVQSYDSEKLNTQEMWDEIADKFCEDEFFVNGNQVRRKWRKLIKIYNTYSQSGKSRRPMHCYRDMQRFIQRNQHADFDREENVNEDVEAGNDESMSAVSGNSPHTQTRSKSILVWSDEMVILLLDEYEARAEQFKNRFVKRKYLWGEIAKVFAEKGYHYGGNQLDSKWKCLKVLANNQNWEEKDDEELLETDEKYALWGKRYMQLIHDTEKVTEVVTVENLPPDAESPLYLWNDAATECFLDELEACLTLLEMKKSPYLKKKYIWLFICMGLAEKGHQMNRTQVESKWKGFIRRITRPTLGAEAYKWEDRVLNIINRLEHLKPTKWTKRQPEQSEVTEVPDWTDECLEILLDEYSNVIDYLEPPERQSNDFRSLVAFSLAKKGHDCTLNEVSQLWKRLEDLPADKFENQLLKEKVATVLAKLKTSMSALASQTKYKPNRADLEGITEWDEDTNNLLISEYRVLKDSSDDNIKAVELWSKLCAVFAERGYHLRWQSAARQWRTLKAGFYSASEKESDSERLSLFPYYKLMQDLVNDDDDSDDEEDMDELIDRDEDTQDCDDESGGHWSDKAVCTLLELFVPCLEYCRGKGMKKYAMWQKMTTLLNEAGHPFSASQVEGKYKGLKRRYLRMQKKHPDIEPDDPSFPWTHMAEMARVMGEIGGENGEEDTQDNGPTQPIKYYGMKTVSWSDEETSELIAQFESHEKLFNNNSVKKKDVWVMIGEKMMAQNMLFTGGQCEGKMKGLKRAYLVKRDRYLKAGAKTFVTVRSMAWPYLESMARIMGEKTLFRSSSVKEEPGVEDTETKLWTHKEITSLLDKILQSMDGYNSPSVTRQKYWEEIADNLAQFQSNFAWEECCEKWKQIMNTYYSKSRSAKQRGEFKYHDKVKEIIDLTVTHQGGNTETHESLQDSWSHEATLRLLDEYQSSLYQFYEPRARHQRIWAEIAHRLAQGGLRFFSSKQCHCKWNKLLFAYRVDQGEISGRGKKNHIAWMYAKKIAAILKQQKSFTKKTHEEESSNSDNEDSMEGWCVDSTELLLREYGARLDQFDDPTVDDQALWTEMAAVFLGDGYSVTVEEIKQRWTALIKEYKQALSDREEGQTVHFRYMVDLEELLGINTEKFAVKTEVEDEVTVNNVTVDDDTPVGDYSNNSNQSNTHLNRDNSFSTAKLSPFGSSKIKTSTPVSKDKLLQVKIKFEDNIPVSTINANSEKNKAVGKETSRLKVLSPKKIKNTPEKQSSSSDHNKVVQEEEGETSKVKIVQDVMTYLQEYENRRDELENARMRELSRMHEHRLAEVGSVSGMVEYLKEYEEKRQQMEQQRARDLAEMERHKMHMLNKLLEK